MKRVLQGTFVAFSVVALTLGAMAAQGVLRSYYANDEVGRNVVMIESHAPLEMMLTRTGQVVGDIRVNSTNIWDDPQARFELDLASLDTGIEARNEHMRGAAWLNTEQYPKAVFTLERVVIPPNVRLAPWPLNDGKTYKIDVIGNLEMRGVSKPVQAQIEVTSTAANEQTAARLKGDLLHVRAKFPIKLSDYGINVPAPAQLKVANEQQVTVDIYSSTESPQPTFATMPEANVEAMATELPAQRLSQIKEINNMNELVVEDIEVGDGAEAKTGDNVTVHYRGTLQDGSQFDASYDRGQPFNFQLGAGRVIKGWDQGVAGMKVGGKRKLTIPPSLGYGAGGYPPVIPPNATLTFEVELLKVK